MLLKHSVSAMCARITNDKQASRALVRTLKEYQHARARGDPEWRSKDQLGVALGILTASATELNPEIERSIWSSLQRTALLKLLGGTEEISLQGLVDQLKAAEAEYLAKPVQTLILVTHLPLDPDQFSGTRRRQNVLIRLDPHLPGAIAKVRSDRSLSLLLQQAPTTEPPPASVVVRAITKGRVPAEGYARASQALDIVRGTWTFILTLRRLQISMGGAPSPINPIPRGPIETIHSQQGSLANPNIWYFPDYPRSIRRFSLNRQDQIEHLRRVERWIIGKLSASTCRASIEEAFARYARATDGTDWSKVYSHLWQLLEWLCSRPKERSANYDVVVNRASSIFTERNDYHRGILNALRSHRNRIVHDGVELGTLAGQGSLGEKQYAYELKSYLDELVFVLVDNAPRLRDRDSFCQLLDDLHLGRQFNKQYESSRFQDYLRRSAKF